MTAAWRDESDGAGEPHYALYYADGAHPERLAAFVAFRPAEGWGWTWAVFRPGRSLSVQEGLAATLDGAKSECIAALQVEVARQLVALPDGWRWVPGMLVWGGDRVTEATLGVAHGALPDLTDDATGGVLLGMLPSVYEVDRDERGYRVRARDSKGDFVPGRQSPWSSTLAEAAARALVAIGRCT